MHNDLLIHLAAARVADVTRSAAHGVDQQERGPGVLRRLAARYFGDGHARDQHGVRGPRRGARGAGSRLAGRGGGPPVARLRRG